MYSEESKVWSEGSEDCGGGEGVEGRTYNGVYVSGDFDCSHEAKKQACFCLGTAALGGYFWAACKFRLPHLPQFIL